MACFMLNICHFNCGRRFETQHDLIVHIEATHIDFDPNIVVETDSSKFQCIPLSYILKYSSDDEIAAAKAADALNKEKMNYKPYDDDEHVVVTRFKDGGTPPSRMKGKAHWYGPEMNPPPAMMNKRDSYNQQMLKAYKSKKYMCPVNGCTKSYKNQNGMKYHIMNFHDLNGNFIKPKKDYKCNYCDKEYKTFRGLQTHTLSHSEKRGNVKSHQAHQGYYAHHSNHHHQHPMKMKHGSYVMSRKATQSSSNGQLLKQSKYMNKKMYMPNNYMLDEYTSATLERNPYLDLESNPRVLVQQQQQHGQGSNVLHKKYDQLQPPGNDAYYSMAATSASTITSSQMARNWPVATAYETNMDYVDGQYMSKKQVHSEDVNEDIGYSTLHSRAYIDQMQQMQQHANSNGNHPFGNIFGHGQGQNDSHGNDEGHNRVITVVNPYGTG